MMDLRHTAMLSFAIFILVQFHVSFALYPTSNNVYCSKSTRRDTDLFLAPRNIEEICNLKGKSDCSCDVNSQRSYLNSGRRSRRLVKTRSSFSLNLAAAGGAKEPLYKVFIGNLPFDVNEKEIGALLDIELGKGVYSKINIPAGKKSKRGLGYIFVDFRDEDRYVM